MSLFWLTGYSFNVFCLCNEVRAVLHEGLTSLIINFRDMYLRVRTLLLATTLLAISIDFAGLVYRLSIYALSALLVF